MDAAAKWLQRERNQVGMDVEAGNAMFWKLVGMRRALLCGLAGVMAWLALSPGVMAGAPDPADYPLRVHIFKYVSRSRHARESKNWSDGPDYVDGDGVADLFENGEPQGFEFSYSCMDSLRSSGGYGTYPARWKKPGKTLEILLPEAGKPWNNVSCGLHTAMRPGLVFCLHNDALAEEAAAVFKEWMAKHEYDPEKGKDIPLADEDGPMGPTEQP